MDTNYLENNYLTLVGKVTGEKKFSHEIYGEKFYVFNLSIPRLSGNADIIPITISERLITDEMLTEGRKLLIKGQFRSYNSYENERNKLILTVFAKDVEELQEVEEQELEKQNFVPPQRKHLPYPPHHHRRCYLVSGLLECFELRYILHSLDPPRKVVERGVPQSGDAILHR